MSDNGVVGPETLPHFEDRVLYHIVDLTGDKPLPPARGVSEADIAIRLADELKITSDFPHSPQFHASDERDMILGTIQELEDEGLLEVHAVAGPWTIRPTRTARRRVDQWRARWKQDDQSSEKSPVLISPPQRDVQEAWVEVAKLRRELQLAKRTWPSLIADEELRRRCEDLLVAESDFDRVIREACVILEHRVRSTIKADDKLTAVPLMELAFSPKNPRLRFSTIEPEQLGAMQLYRSIMAFFRNTTGHHLIDTYTQDDALRFVSWIDLLLTMLKKAEVSD